MLGKKDITLLKGMFVENNALIRKEIKEDLETLRKDLKREIRDETHSLISASEKRVITQIADLLHESVFPQIAELQAKVS